MAAVHTARRYLVSGLVQGVGFRWATARLARSLGIRGTVRNLPDGAVEVEAHGAAELLDRFREALGSGMPGRVDAVRMDPIEVGETRTLDDFRIVS